MSMGLGREGVGTMRDRLLVFYVRVPMASGTRVLI